MGFEAGDMDGFLYGCEGVFSVSAFVDNEQVHIAGYCVIGFCVRTEQHNEQQWKFLFEDFQILFQFLDQLLPVKPGIVNPNRTGRSFRHIL